MYDDNKYLNMYSLIILEHGHWLILEHGMTGRSEGLQALHSGQHKGRQAGNSKDGSRQAERAANIEGDRHLEVGMKRKREQKL
jgi:hypothetical protein